MKAPQPTEHEIQAAIVDALRVCGLTVYSTTAYRQKGPSGVDRGVPDLLVCVDGLPGIYIGLEVKRPGPVKWSSPEQLAAYKDMRFFVASSVPGALRAVFNFMFKFMGHENRDQIFKMAQMIESLEGKDADGNPPAR